MHFFGRPISVALSQTLVGEAGGQQATKPAASQQVVNAASQQVVNAETQGGLVRRIPQAPRRSGLIQTGCRLRDSPIDPPQHGVGLPEGEIEGTARGSSR